MTITINCKAVCLEPTTTTTTTYTFTIFFKEFIDIFDTRTKQRCVCVLYLGIQFYEE